MPPGDLINFLHVHPGSLYIGVTGQVKFIDHFVIMIVGIIPYSEGRATRPGSALLQEVYEDADFFIWYLVSWSRG